MSEWKTAMGKLITKPSNSTDIPKNKNSNSYATTRYISEKYDYSIKNHSHSHKKLFHDRVKLNKFAVVHQNIRGLNNKTDELLISLSPSTPQIICLTEHHLKPDEIGNICLGHYTLGTSFCRRSFKQGGVCIFASDNTSTEVIDLEQHTKEKDLEICALQTYIASACFVIICVYRSPTGDFNYFIDQLEVILNRIYKISRYIILCGDFNINFLENNTKKYSLDALLASFNLSGIVNFPTRTSYQSSTQIDNIFINTQQNDYFIQPLNNGLSDHDGQILTFPNVVTFTPKHTSIKVRKMNEHSIMNFTLLLSYENWEEVFQDNDINTIFNKFLNTYLRIFNTSFPYTVVNNAYNNKPWLTSGIKISCATKRKLYLCLKKNSDQTYREYYKLYCHILSKVIVLAKKLYYNNLIDRSNNKQKTTWNVVRKITNNRNIRNNVSFMKSNNKQPCKQTNIANAFNSYFVSIAESLINNNTDNSQDCINPLTYLDQNFNCPIIPLNLKKTTTHEIGKIIHDIKTKDSSGYDEISTRILKISSPYVVSPLTFIFNKILSTGVFPERLKYSEVIPVFKKGDSGDFANYRPISILTSFSKIIEKIIYKRLYKYLQDNNILANEQFGFRDNSSTDTATYAFLNNILSALDNGNYTGSLFCDLQKAFDSVNHDILLAKLDFYGISGLALKLIKSYLENRYQRVTVNNLRSQKIVSTWEIVKHGVPQGSVLGPLLFLVYINDFPSTINKLASTILFADDTSIIISNSNSVDFINNVNAVMTEIMNWFKGNLLTLNLNKTTFLQFLTKNSNKEIKTQIFSSNLINTNINSTKFLGILIDNTLSWSDHTSTLASKLNRASYAIRTIKPLMSTDGLRNIYFSYAHSLISYGIIFWGNSHHSTKIFKLQKRIIRTIINIGRRDSCRKLFSHLQILTLTSQYIFSLLVFVVKNRKLFTTNAEIHKLNTRYNKNLHLSSTKLTLVQKGVLYSGSKIFNHLPSSIKTESGDIKRFKILLKRYLNDHAFYSLDEYYQCQ